MNARGGMLACSNGTWGHLARYKWHCKFCKCTLNRIAKLLNFKFRAVTMRDHFTHSSPTEGGPEDLFETGFKSSDFLFLA